MLKTLALPAALLAAFTLPARAQLIVANDQSGTATFYNVDPTTGIATPIYSGTGTEAKAWGMAFDSASNTLYWNNGGTLFSSPLGATLTPTNLGALTAAGSTINFVALSFRGGKLWGTRNISSATAPEVLYEIDTTTLIATQVYAYNVSFDFGGLDHDPVTGTLYGLSDSAPAPAVRGLYEIDPVAMTTTFKAPYPAGETDIDALAVNNGRAYYVTDGPNTTQANFFIFDIATGTQVGTIPSPFTGSGTFAAATWAGNVTPPPQSTPYCFGDGSGAACPCANSGAAGNGCASSVNANGANITTSGTPSLAADSLTLLGSGMPNASALYFQGTTQQSGGLGVGFGDGLRCVAGSIVRLKTVTNVAGSSQYPEAGDASVSVRGMVAAPGVRNYQVWYRNAASFCTAATFNLTNGTSVTWLP